MNILEAAKSGFYSEVKRCLEEKEPVHVVDPSGFTPLHWAAAMGHTFVAELLIEHGANVNVKGSRLDVLPLHLAALNNHPEMIDLLIQKGAERDAPNSQGANAIDIAISLEDNFEAVMALVKQGATFEDKHKIELKEMFCNSLMIDHVDFVKFIVEQGNHLRNFLAGNESLIMGYHLPLVIAAANASPKCLTYIIEQDPGAVTLPMLSMGNLMGMSMLSFVKLYMPPREFFEGNFNFFANQQDVDITKPEDLKILIPEAIAEGVVSVEYDKENERFYFDKLMYGMVQIEFNADGTVKNMDKILENLTTCIKLLQEKGQDINPQDGLMSGSTTTDSLISCPAAIIQCFVNCGLTFSGADLQTAIASAPSDVVRVIIESGADIRWENNNGQNAIDFIMKTDNDLILNDRPDLIRLMEDKADIPNEKRVFQKKEEPMLHIFNSHAVQNFMSNTFGKYDPMDIDTPPPGASRFRHFSFQ